MRWTLCFQYMIWTAYSPPRTTGSRRWGKKMAVVVDKHFFESLGHMEEVGDLSSGDIAWFTVDFEEDPASRRFRLVRDRVRVTTLERATEELTGGSPVTLTEFEDGIRSKLTQ